MCDLCDWLCAVRLVCSPPAPHTKYVGLSADIIIVIVSIIIIIINITIIILVSTGSAVCQHLSGCRAKFE